MKEALCVKDLCKTYVTNKRQNNVLKNVNFTVYQGEMVAVMGPSGSGKSTLLYSVSGMDRPTAGEVLLAGKQITDLKERELAKVRLTSMGFIFQQMHMLKNLSIMDNILLPAYQADKSRSRQEINEFCLALMRKLGISDVAGNDITEVSGGQLQRACICRSLINQPEILFADEPTGNVVLVQHYPKEIPVILFSLSMRISEITERHNVRFSSRDRALYIF